MGALFEIISRYHLGSKQVRAGRKSLVDHENQPPVGRKKKPPGARGKRNVCGDPRGGAQPTGAAASAAEEPARPALATRQYPSFLYSSPISLRDSLGTLQK